MLMGNVNRGVSLGSDRACAVHFFICSSVIMLSSFSSWFGLVFQLDWKAKSSWAARLPSLALSRMSLKPGFVSLTGSLLSLKP
jgi:hypothetical protein